MRVLVIDDSQVIRTIIIKELHNIGITQIEQAEDGLEAIRKLSGKLYDAVTLDITMPKADGIEVLKHIKKNSPTTKIIMITSLNHKDMVMEAIKIGIDDYLIKPFSVERLQDIIKRHIAPPQG